MKKQLVRFAMFLGMLLLLALPVAAHEGREVGEFLLEFGWQVEPAYAWQPNGIEVSIEAHHDEAEDAEHEHADEPSPLEGIEINLQAEVTFGDQSMIILLEPAYGELGHYVGNITPTMPGDYTFHITGTIGDVTVDETFSSADGEFSSVEPQTDVLFPLPAGGDLQVQIAALEARIAALEAQLAATPAP
ncbi:MAG: hypothetical protein U0694_11240 [Anaerolineae bacterium]